MTRSVSLLTGFAFGLACMYVVDPSEGRRRRALARAKLRRAFHRTGEGVDAAIRDTGNRISGGINEIYQSMQPDEASDDQVAERVRAALGRAVSHPRAILVTAENGRVCLSGPILAHDVRPLLEAAASVRGVAAIDNQLDVHDQAGNIPALQGDPDSDSQNRRSAWQG